jgi:predicted Rossmann fold nucleotide-binding protein DprA/Smf involved in DNA uptake
MERNLLIHAAAEATVVVHARFKAGGGWHGAVAALRRRVSHVLVREDPTSRAHCALIAIGARPLRAAEDLGPVLEALGHTDWQTATPMPATPSLFSIA